MSFEGQGHFFTIYFSGFVCFVLYKAKISGEHLQDHWSSGYYYKMLHFIFEHNAVFVRKKPCANINCKERNSLTVEKQNHYKERNSQNAEY